MKPVLRPATTVPTLVAVAAVVIAVVLGVNGPGHSGAAVAAAGTGAPGTVTVSGVGSVNGVPDTLTAMLTVHVTRPSVQSALDGVASAAGRVLAAARHAGLARRSVQTSDLQLSQHYDNHGTVTGYDASESVRVRISPLTHAGATLSSVIGSAGDAVSVDGLSFDIVHDDALLQQARAAAWADAHGRADQYAGLSGRSLGGVDKVTETVQQAQQPMYYGDALAAGGRAAAKALPVQPGEQPVAVTVTVTWTLR